MPPELIHLPSRVPLNLYDFACWARGTIAPLLIVLSRKPVRPLGFGVEELVAPGSQQRLHRVPGTGVFWWLDKLQKLYERLPRQPGRARARRSAHRTGSPTTRRRTGAGAGSSRPGSTR